MFIVPEQEPGLKVLKIWQCNLLDVANSLFSFICSLNNLLQSVVGLYSISSLYVYSCHVME